MSRVRDSAQFIVENAKYVTVDRERCTKVAREISQRMTSQKYSPETWSTHQLNPSSKMPHVIDWIFTVDTLNFSFWQDEPRFTVQYENKSWTGYWSLVAAINRAIDEKIPIISPAFWVSPEFSIDILAHIFRSDTEGQIPLLEERYAVLKQAGEALAAHGYTSFSDVINAVNGSALSLVDWLVANIASYNDSAMYKGREVKLYKRAQIVVADLWACGVAKFTDIGEITMFADYRVPQMLAVLGCITYSPELLRKIQAKQLIPSGNAEEVEIRGCSIHAVELIVDTIRKFGSNNDVNAVLVDFYLWDTAKEEEAVNTQKFECHRTRSVFY